MSSITALIAWIIGLIPCALVAVIGAPAKAAEPANHQMVQPQRPLAQPVGGSIPDLALWGLVAAIAAGTIYLASRAS